MSAGGEPRVTPWSEAELLARYAPVLRFDQRELFFPTEVDGYVTNSSLWIDDREQVPEGALALDQLDQRWDQASYLRFVSDTDLKSVVAEEAARLARKLLSPRLGRVGLFGRVLDALFLVGVFVRPTTPRRMTPAAALKAERIGLDQQPVCYARARRSGEWLVLHYAYFYVMNDWRTGYRGLNDHEADWEQAWVFVDPATLEPCWVVATSHDHTGPDLRRHWADPEVIKQGTHPVLHAGAGSHALYFQPGDYITRLDVPALRPVLRLQRWVRSVLRIRDEATERGLGPALGAPFVETATGDGRAIHEWDIRLLTTEQPWLADYRGLWGLDTGDPLDGERGPSGPKFDRRGEIRVSWADPVGFAGLHGTPPPSATDRRINQTKIDRALGDIDEQIQRRARLLPLAEATDNADDMEDESIRLTQLLRQRTELVDLSRRLADDELPPTPRREHLRFPATPLPPPAGGSWLLAFWAAASIPLILIAIGAIFLFDEVRLVGVVFVVGAVTSLSEQLARHHYQAVARLALVYAVVIGIYLFEVGGLITVSRYGIGALLIVGAGLLFFVNLSELGAAQRFRQRAQELARLPDPVSGDRPGTGSDSERR